MPNSDDQILGTTAKIDAQDAIEILASRAAEIDGNSSHGNITNDIDEVTEDLSQQEAADLGPSPVASSARKRRQNPDVAARQQYRTQREADTTAENLRRQQLKTEAQAAKAEADIRTANAKARIAEARADKAVPSPIDPAIAEAAVDFAIDFEGFRDEAPDAWMDYQTEKGIPVTEKSMRALRPEMVENFPQRPKILTPAERQAAELENFAETFKGERGTASAAFQTHLAEKGLLTPAQEQARVLAELGTPAKKQLEMGMGFQIAFGATQAFTGASRGTNALTSGESYIPAQALEQSITGAAPALLGIGASALSMKLGPGASMAIGMGVQGLAQMGADAIDNYATGHTFATQRASEELGMGRGGVGVMNDFIEAISRASASTKDLSDTMTQLGRGGQMTPGFARYYGDLEGILGTSTKQTVLTAGQYLQNNDATNSLYNRMSAGALTSDEALGQSFIALQSGNYDAATSLRAISGASPRWTQYADTLNSQWRQHRDDLETLGIASSASQGQLALTMLQGGSAADIDASNMSPNGKELDQQAVSTIQSDMAPWYEMRNRFGSNPIIRQQIDKILNGYLLKSQSFEMDEAQRDRASFDAHENEDAAGYALGRSQDQYQVTVGLLQGGGYDDLQDIENASLTRQQARAAQRRQLAATSPYARNPAVRDQMLTEATAIESGAATDAYAFDRNIDRQAVDANNIGISRAQSGLERTLAYAGPEAYGSAFAQEASAYATKIQELTNQLQRGGLTVDDYNRKEAELIQTRRAANSLPGEEARATYGAQLAISGAQISVATAAAATGRIMGGSDVSNPLIMAAMAQERSQAALFDRQASDPRLSQPERERARANAAQARLGVLTESFDLVRYDQEPGGQGHQIDVEGALARAGRSFTEQGNISSLRSEALRLAREDVTGYDAQIRTQFGANVPDYLKPAIAQQRNQLLGKVTDLSESMDADFFRNLPAMTIGSTSFMQRLLPSAAEAAQNMESRGYGSIGARNFGFFRHQTGVDITGEFGETSAMGQSYAGTHPGNASAQAVAIANAVAVAVTQALSNTKQSMDITIRDGADTRKASGRVQTTVTRAQGMGQVLPGMPKH